MKLWDDVDGYVHSDALSDTLRSVNQPMVRFREHCDPDDQTKSGLHKGATYYWNVYGDTSVQGGELVEDSEIPTATYSEVQSSLTVTEYGLAVPFTQKLDNLSRHPVEQIIKKILGKDSAKAMDIAAHAQFDATLLVCTAASGTSITEITVEVAGTATATNNVALGDDHVKAIVDEMSERDIPAFNDGNYRCIGRPKTFRPFKNDLEALHSYVQSGFDMILHGEIGRSYEGCRFFTQTNIASESWTNGKSDAAYFFGDDTVNECVVVPEEIRGKIPTDFGRSKGVAWYALGGFGIVHNATGAADNRIMKWASAA